jgi:hypothetical protein
VIVRSSRQVSGWRHRSATIACVDDVVPGAGLEPVGARTADERVGPAAAEQRVRAVAALEVAERRAEQVLEVVEHLLAVAGPAVVRAARRHVDGHAWAKPPTGSRYSNRSAPAPVNTWTASGIGTRGQRAGTMFGLRRKTFCGS